MSKYTVWIEMSKRDFSIEVEADNESEAREKALEEAPFLAKNITTSVENSLAEKKAREALFRWQE